MYAEWMARVSRRVSEAAGRRVGEGVVKLSASDLATCPAKAYYEAIGVGEAWRDPLHRLYSEYAMLLGREFHRILGHLAGGEREVPVEVPVEAAGLRGVVHGRADLVLRASVVEVKTSISLDVKAPRLQGFLLQAGFYAAALGLDQAVVVVFSRCRPRCRAYSIHGDAVKRAMEVIVHRARRVLEALAGRAQPPAHPGDWCSYCRFHGICRLRSGGQVGLPIYFKPGEVETIDCGGA